MIRTLARTSILTLFFACSPARGTSIVVLANRTQIAVAADSAETDSKGKNNRQACKIFRLRNFFFVVSGTFRKDEIDSLAVAAQGTDDLVEIQKRFNELVKKPLEAVVENRLAHVPSYAMELRGNTQVLQVIIFRLDPTGPVLAESMFPFKLLKSGKVRIEDAQTRICKNGEGECSLIIGEAEEAKQYVSKHPLGQDLIADAEQLVRIEAEAHPGTVGGNISMLLLDAGGTHPINMSPGCPWRITVRVSR
jgi:hypothetical protein